MIKLFISFFFVFSPSGPEKVSGKVIRVIDGNTIELLNPDKEVVKIMLSEVDCPEPGQEYAEEAKKFTEKLVLRKRVVVEMKGKDRWGNKLGQVVLNNGKLLHHELLKSGLAWAREEDNLSLLSMQQAAKESKNGLWGHDDPTPPWVYRRQQTMMAPKGR
ncbi:thermonuclease family protein [Fulvivirga sp. 29W222]|uniref:Thermonuclease family protein n=1 Tax=Fulvivirga marina TaxID=2494733 RepID=A0A937G4A1_9BACT|nr:thermonuclease family protein [Fulvivirga marina]MBL6449753.1 thermonuclease family protein [Fulvivirga marina]